MKGNWDFLCAIPLSYSMYLLRIKWIMFLLHWLDRFPLTVGKDFEISSYSCLYKADEYHLFMFKADPDYFKQVTKYNR